MTNPPKTLEECITWLSDAVAVHGRQAEYQAARAMVVWLWKEKTAREILLESWQKEKTANEMFLAIIEAQKVALETLEAALKATEEYDGPLIAGVDYAEPCAWCNQIHVGSAKCQGVDVAHAPSGTGEEGEFHRDYGPYYCPTCKVTYASQRMCPSCLEFGIVVEEGKGEET
jgi:hypothetical protein